MWYVWFKITDQNGEMVEACLAKGYKTKGNATKYAKKTFGSNVPFVVAMENPFIAEK